MFVLLTVTVQVCPRVYYFLLRLTLVLEDANQHQDDLIVFLDGVVRINYVLIYKNTNNTN